MLAHYSEILVVLLDWPPVANVLYAFRRKVTTGSKCLPCAVLYQLLTLKCAHCTAVHSLLLSGVSYLSSAVYENGTHNWATYSTGFYVNFGCCPPTNVLSIVRSCECRSSYLPVSISVRGQESLIYYLTWLRVFTQTWLAKRISVGTSRRKSRYQNVGLFLLVAHTRPNRTGDFFHTWRS